MQNSDNPLLTPPSLPKGGGALTGLGGTMGAIGPSGSASFSIPLPLSAGRGYAPSIGLNYSSQSGSGDFGMGWSSGLPRISRDIKKGVPSYNDKDRFLSPDGELLIALRDKNNNIVQKSRHQLLETTLGATYKVSTYRPRVESSFTCLEFWQPEQPDLLDFWVMYSPDGQVGILGNTEDARMMDPEEKNRTAGWLLTASVSLTGEQIYYQYRAENLDNCDESERQLHSKSTAQRYLIAAHYGNQVAQRALPGLDEADPLKTPWLFSLVFDYGERSTKLTDIPQWKANSSWLCRQDPFSRYEYGFEIRTRRLCRQVLMFHRIKNLEGQLKTNEIPTLISRLLFEYHETPTISTMISARQMAWENDADQKQVALPPLEMGWQTFTPPKPNETVWEERKDLCHLNPLQPYQFVDLKGEGVAGVLYRDTGAWWYREPVRKENSSDINAITWGKPEKLPVFPSLQNAGTLVDLTGEGRLQWVVTTPGLAGHYGQNAKGEWLHFTPLNALPTEYFHPKAQLATLVGSGCSDLVMIGPRAVRLYAGHRSGWSKGEIVAQPEGVNLPTPDSAANTLVAFVDILGSGQQHLIQIKSDGVTCWPNLGKGHFGHPIPLPGFSQPYKTFNPERLFLADVDGSGAADLIYAHSDHLEIYLNESGNRFAVPFSLALPEGIRFDNTCSIQIADVQGLGVASLLLTCPHSTVRHWVYSFSQQKPWLLNETNNNMGAHNSIHYRSSAQFWLDEKARYRAQGNSKPACYLPFAMHLLWRTEVEDEITGNRLSSEACYRHGVWDGREREFRGYGYVETKDTDLINSKGTSEKQSMPSLTCAWFATGNADIDSTLPSEYCQLDDAAFPGFVTRFTKGSGDNEITCTEEEVNKLSFWLHRALKGIPLRSELYGLDNSVSQTVPYTVTENRLQVRVLDDSDDSSILLPSIVESRVYNYERMILDPHCSQTIVLNRDEYGQTLREATVMYPRRGNPETVSASSKLSDQAGDAISLANTERAYEDKDVEAAKLFSSDISEIVDYKLSMVAGTKGSVNSTMRIVKKDIRSCTWTSLTADFPLQKAVSTGDNAWHKEVEGLEARALAPQDKVGVARYELKFTDNQGEEKVHVLNINVVLPMASIVGKGHATLDETITFRTETNFKPNAYKWRLLRDGETVEQHSGEAFAVDVRKLTVGTYRVILDVEDWDRGVSVEKRLIVVNYPFPLPDTLPESSYDEQQTQLYVSVQQSSWHSMVEIAKGTLLLGLADASRGDTFSYPASRVPEAGLSIEALLGTNSLISEGKPCTFIGQQQVFYLDSKNKPVTQVTQIPPLVAWSESAAMDAEQVKLVSDSLGIGTEELEKLGYHQANYLFPKEKDEESRVWVVRSGTAQYGTKAQFWRPLKQKASELVGENTFTWDRHYCVIKEYEDPIGLRTKVKYDYRFFAPIEVQDANDNIQQIELDALGRNKAARFWGTENGKDVGYSKQPFTLPETVDKAINLKGQIPVSEAVLSVPDAWRLQLSEKVLAKLNKSHPTLRRSLSDKRLLTEDGYLRAMARRDMDRADYQTLLSLSGDSEGLLPPHALVLTTDRYDNDSEQQIRQQVVFSDGFGRLLQTSVRYAPGEAWMRGEKGQLIEENGKPKTAETDFRWAVSGRIEYDNKGQTVRAYQPFFLDDWRYVKDDSARTDLYSDTLYYDPVGRNIKTVTAKGYLRRAFATAWFTVEEDENDTAAEVLGASNDKK